MLSFVSSVCRSLILDEVLLYRTNYILQGAF